MKRLRTDFDLVRDVRLAWQSLVRTPNFTIPAVSALALGFALLATTVAVVNAYLIRSLPYPQSEQLYHVVYAPTGTPEPRGLSGLDWRSLADIVEFADSSASTRLLVTNGDVADEVVGMLAAPGAIEASGARVGFGRDFLPDDFRAGERVALIDQSFWRTRFGGDSTVIGQTLLVGPASGDAEPYAVRVIGVLDGELRDPRRYGIGSVQVVMPNLSPSRTYVVRLRDGIPVPVAERSLTAAVRAVASTLPDSWQGVRLESLHERYVRSMRPVLIAVTVASVLVLLIVCANVAVLMLLRALRRQTEIAVRVALGAGFTRILRMVTIESALICAVAIAAALGVSAVALELIAPAIETALGQPVPRGLAAMGIDPVVAMAVAIAGVATAVLLSAVPLLAPWQRRLTEALRRGGRGATDSGAVRGMQTGLVIAQLALSVALATGCALTVRSAVHLMRTDLGVDTRDVARVRVVTPRHAYHDADALNQFHDQMLNRMRARSRGPVALSSFPVLIEATPVSVETEHTPDGAQLAGSMAVTDAFFPMLGAKIVLGRDFTDADRAATEPVAIVSQTLAQRLWEPGGALGSRIRTAGRTDGAGDAGQWRTVVGVVSDVRQSYTDDNLSDLYIPFFQGAGLFTSAYTRSDGSQAGWLEVARAAVAETDPRVYVGSATSLEAEAERQLGGPKFLASALTAFAVIASLLAVIGNYAVVAYAVQQREREVAIRAALGATPQAIASMFLRRGGWVVAVGVALGAIGAAGAGRVLVSQLHGISPFDPAAMLVGCVLVGVVVMVFVWLPARRAATISPSDVLNNS